MEFQETPADPANYLPPPPKRRSRTKIILLAALASLLTITLIVGGGVLLKQRAEENRRAEEAAAKREAAEKAEEERLAAIEACQDALGDYMQALSDIDARLDVGLTQDDLSDLTGEASIQKSRVDVSELSDTCQQAKDKADLALDAYSLSVIEWEDCIWDDWCDPEWGVDLQTPWARATERIEEAKDLMNGEVDGETT